MAFCTKCGKEVNDETRFCPYCGQERADVPKVEVAADPRDAADNKVFGILAYIGILVLIPILAAPKNSVFSRFHANQGLVLWITSIILSVASSVLNAVGEVLWILGLVTGLVSGAAGIFRLVLMIMGIVSAAKGEMKELPIIGKFRILK